MVLINLLGAIAILLWSTRMVRKGISRFMGAKLPAMISRATKNRMRAVITGVGVAGMLQSASATGVLAVSFARKGVLSIPMGIAILLGADVGSTLMVQVLTFDVSWLSPIAFLLGYFVFVRGQDTHIGELGRALMGIGLILLSLQIMSNSMNPLKESEVFLNILATISSQTWLGILLVAIVTWFMHSSIAMVLIIIGLAVSGTVSPQSALIFVIGANIGAGFIPFILTLKEKSEVRHIPLASLLVRTLVGVLLVPFIWIISPFWNNAFDNVGLGIAMFHTAFNLLVLVVGVPFINTLADICKLIIPVKQQIKTIGAKLLLPEYINSPSKALNATEREVLTQADFVETMLQDVIDVIENDDLKKAKQIAKMDNNVDALYEDIKLYITKVSASQMTAEESQRTTNTITYTTNLEHVGDIIEYNLLDIANKKVKGGIMFTDEGWRDIQKLHSLVMQQLRLSVAVFMRGNVEDARQLLIGKRHLKEVEVKANNNHFERLRADITDSVKSSALHLDMVRDLKRINTHLSSIAYPILEKHGELPKNRIDEQDE